MAGSTSNAGTSGAPLRVLVHGAGGRVGQLLLPLIQADAGLELVGALVRAGSAWDGQPVAAGRADGVHYSAQWPAPAVAVDVVIDFALPSAFAALLQEVRARGCALVSGTTGLDDAQQAALDTLAQQVPVLWASNFSLGVAVLTRLVREARALLPPSFECAVFESHHSAKRDAPSGTALTLAAAAAGEGSAPPISSLRAGRIVGEHEVYFAGAAERLELVHRAADRNVFAHGALAAARWIAGRAAGRYALDAVLSPVER